MPSLKDTKRRILSVKGTQKITRAMKLVSSAKFTRANHEVLNARPYGHSLDQMIQRIAAQSAVQSPLIEQRIEKKILLIAIATDRGLCGGLNTNLLKTGAQFVESKKKQGIQTEFMLWGRRAEGVCSGSKATVRDRHEKVLDKPSYHFALNQAKQVQELFLRSEYESVYILYSEFKNALTQTPALERILPIGVKKEDISCKDVLFEPKKEAMIDGLLFKQLASKMYRILLEGTACEHAARMTAMDNATRNADEVIRSLTLQYNRARQAAITKELIEITSGAEAL